MRAAGAPCLALPAAGARHRRDACENRFAGVIPVEPRGTTTWSRTPRSPGGAALPGLTALPVAYPATCRQDLAI